MYIILQSVYIICTMVFDFLEFSYVMIISVNWEDLADEYWKVLNFKEVLLNFLFSFYPFFLDLFGQYYHFLRNFKEINSLMHNPSIYMDQR